MLSKYQRKMLIFIIFLLVMLKKLVPNFFDKYVFHYENMQLYLRLGLKLKKTTSHIGNQSITMVKTIY